MSVLEKRKIAPENLFLIIGSIFGVLWCFLTPPFQIPDEFNHFCRAYMISQGNIIPTNDSVNNLGYYLPQSLRNVEKELEAVPIQFHWEKKQDLNRLRIAMRTKLDEDKLRFIGFANTSIYAPIPYVPQASGIWVGRVLDLSVLSTHYLARVFNLISFLAWGYWAIKRMPILKLSIMVIALLPISLHLSASLSADPAILGSSLCFIAYVVYLIMAPLSQKISTKDVFMLVMFSLVFSLSKVAYLPLCLLLFMVPQSKFNSPQSYWGLGLLLIIINLLVIGIWSMALQGIHIPFTVVPKEQILSIIQYPGVFLQKLLNTVFSSQHYTSAFTLGWLDTPLPRWMIFVYGFLVGTSCLIVEKSQGQLLYKRQGLIFISLFAALAIGLHVALYITWNQLVPNKIDGLQGRYFLPILLLVPVGLKMIAPRGLLKSDLTMVYGVVLSIMLLVSSYVIFVRYYLV